MSMKIAILLMAVSMLASSIADSGSNGNADYSQTMNDVRTALGNDKSFLAKHFPTRYGKRAFVPSAPSIYYPSMITSLPTSDNTDICFRLSDIMAKDV